MIETIARILCAAWHGENLDEQNSLWKEYKKEARAIIEAMKWPTEKLLLVGAINSGASSRVKPQDRFLDGLQAMMDEALKDNS